MKKIYLQLVLLGLLAFSIVQLAVSGLNLAILPTQKLFSTDFESVTVVDPNTLSLAFPHWVGGPETGGGSVWIEGLDRNSGITSHGGSRSLGMEITDHTLTSGIDLAFFSSPRFSGGLPSEYTLSYWMFLPTGFTLPLADDTFTLCTGVTPLDVWLPFVSVRIKPSGGAFTFVLDQRNVAGTENIIASAPNVAVPVGSWFNIKYHVIAANDQTGQMQFYLNDIKLLEGVNIPTLGAAGTTGFQTSIGFTEYSSVANTLVRRAWIDDLEISQGDATTGGSTKGTVQGHVSSSSTGASISGATVIVDSLTPVTTDGAGNYAVSNVPFGVNIPITATAGGYNSYASTISLSGATLTKDIQMVPTSATLIISAGAGGTTDPSPGTYSFTVGSTVSLTAIPNSGNSFVQWVSGSNVYTTNPYVASLSAATTYTFNAIFQPVQNKATLIVSSGVGGSTNLDGSHTYDVGTSVQLIATPNSGYAFKQWVSGGTSIFTDNPHLVTFSSASTFSFVADFQSTAPTTATVVISASLGGSTNPAPGTYTFNVGESLVLTAIPDSSHWFARWLSSEFPIYNDNPHTFVLSSATTYPILAEFHLNPVATLVLTAGAGGTTNPVPGSYTYAVGDSVVLTAIPNTGYSFVQWTTPIGTSSVNPLQITFSASGTFSYGVSFAEISSGKATLVVSATSGGSISPESGTYTLDVGASVNLTAMANLGYRFVSWDVDGIAYYDNPHLLTVASADTYVCTAIFAPTQQFAVPSLLTSVWFYSSIISCLGLVVVTKKKGNEI